MIQQISTNRADAPSVVQASSGKAQDSDEFRSMLKEAAADSPAVQNNTDGARDVRRTGGSSKKKEPTKGTDVSGGDGTNAGPVQQNALQPGISVPTDAAALFVSEGGRTALQPGGAPQAENTGDSGKENTTARVSAGTLPQMKAKLPPGVEKQETNPSAQVPLSDGKKTLVSVQPPGGTGPADCVSAANAVQANGNPGRPVTAKGDSGQALPGSDSGRPVLSAGSNEQKSRRSSEGLQTVQATGGADGKTDSVSSGTANGTARPFKTETGSAQVRTADSKDGTTYANGSFPDLYGTGKIVIRVSGEPEQAKPSPVRQVANAAVHQLQSGKTEFRMDLYPKSLGKVSVKLTAQNGLLTVEIAASDPKTQSLLASGSSEIRSILQASTGQNVQTVVPNQQAQQWYGQSQDGRGNSENQRQKREEPRKDKWNGIGSVSAELNTGDFLTMIQQIGAYAR
jgi:flagellar hook-length control protein FliK